MVTKVFNGNSYNKIYVKTQKLKVKSTVLSWSRNQETIRYLFFKTIYIFKNLYVSN